MIINQRQVGITDHLGSGTTFASDTSVRRIDIEANGVEHLAHAATVLKDACHLRQEQCFRQIRIRYVTNLH